ncbi:hypothetical protein L7F22_040291 [Adiantum nelumboides]|nr:hypothetical protein [Adiantum nelumboides]
MGESAGAAAHKQQRPPQGIRGGWCEGALEGEEGRRARKKAGEMKKVMREACEQETQESFTNLLRLYEDMKAITSAI